MNEYYDTWLETSDLTYLTESAKNIQLLRRIAQENGQSLQQINENQFFKELKREYRVRKNSYLRQAKEVWQRKHAISFGHLYENGDAYYTKYYVMTCDGSKEDAYNEFDTYYASKIYSPYDCTGEWFTCGVKIARIDENHWFVRECLDKDI